MLRDKLIWESIYVFSTLSYLMKYTCKKKCVLRFFDFMYKQNGKVFY